MNEIEARQIARLLNKRNQLSRNLNHQNILEHSENYFFLKNNESVSACICHKKVQWYQFEICHISVDEIFEGKGLAQELLCKVEDIIKQKQGRVIQCTIRSDNTRSIKLFSKNGYKKVNQFLNSNTGNHIDIYQKII